MEHGETEAGRGLSLLPASTNRFCSHLLYLLESMGDFVWKSVHCKCLNTAGLGRSSWAWELRDLGTNSSFAATRYTIFPLWNSAFSFIQYEE